ncbi:hypothetical protein SADO_07097 [Salinisphaera dokdonensis CL-ES53]|uniref:SHOCT domain-containing protein n=1 Tax=Salinisphaera dokdonensis CL-ES53 TaxID=1304272 RepID=A0ABV2AZD1_9GAMM
MSKRHGFSEEAVRHMETAVIQGHGSMAAFDHPEFGGPGQWMRGGLLMLSDAFNHELKARVDALCNTLSGQVRLAPGMAWGTATQNSWWPAELGEPTATGQQNDLHYAYFADTQRLAVRRGDEVSVYDTGDHRIQGVSQQHTDGHSAACFTSQHGPVDLASLPRVASESRSNVSDEDLSTPTAAAASHDVFDAIERLGELLQRGLLTEKEFADKKQALLARI